MTRGEGPLAGPRRIRLAAINDFSAASLHGFMSANIAPDSTAKTDGWLSYPGAPEITHEPHIIGTMAAHVVLPWVHRVFSNLKTWLWAFTTACAPSTSKPTSTSSSCASTDAAPATPPSARCSASPAMPSPSPTRC